MGVSIASTQLDIPLRTLVDNAPVMTWVVGPDQRFTFFNKGWLAFTGRTLDHKQAPTADWLLSVHPDDHARYLETYTRAFATQQEFEVEYRLRRHDGVYRWVWDRAVPHFAPDGAFLGFAGGCIDITERRELEAALQRSEARFHAAQELSLDGFVLLESVRDAAGRLIDFTFAYVNPSAAAMLGRPVGAFAGQRLLDLYPGVREQSDLFARWVQVVETGESHDIETWYAADGVRGWFRNMAVKLDDGLAVTFHEITDRKWLEGALLVGEEAVAQQLAELQAIYATAPVGLAVLDTNLCYIRINERLAAMNGQPAAAHLGRTVYAMIPDLAEEVARILRQVMAQGKPLLDNEIRSRPSPQTGIVRTWLQSCYPLRDSSGQVVGLNVVVQEITERKRAEEALQRLVACTLTSGPDFFRALTCALTEALGVRYAFVAELLPTADPSGATCVRTIALWADGKQGETMNYDLAGTPCADVVKQQTCFYPREVQCLFPADKLLAEMGVESYLGAPLRAADGTTLGLLVVMHDQPIDETLQPLALLQIFAGHAAAELERMRNEEALRAGEERYRIITDSVPGLIGYVDREERYQFVNAAYEQWFGIPCAQIVGRTIRELLTPAIYAEVQSYVRRVLAGEQVTFERQIRYVDGHKTILATYTPHSERLPDPPGGATEQVVGFYVLVMDITQRKQTEDRLRLAEGQLRQLNEQLEQRIAERTLELERSNRDLDQFAYAASHDLKAPLRAIQQLALWIEEDGGALLPATAQKRLQTLRGRAQRLEKLLTDLLAYARAGREHHLPQTVQTQALVQDVVEMLAPPSTLTITQTDLPTLQTVRIPLETVLRNLISNAIKYHHRLDGHIWITAQEQGDFIEFAVADDGPGIPAHFHRRIFDLFQTLQSRDQVEGSGMGLALVKKLVERYGGIIRVESTVGQGTTFRFTWPRRIDTTAG